MIKHIAQIYNFPNGKPATQSIALKVKLPRKLQGLDTQRVWRRVLPKSYVERPLFVTLELHGLSTVLTTEVWLGGDPDHPSRSLCTALIVPHNKPTSEGSSMLKLDSAEEVHWFVFRWLSRVSCGGFMNSRSRSSASLSRRLASSWSSREPSLRRSR